PGIGTADGSCAALIADPNRQLQLAGDQGQISIDAAAASLEGPGAGDNRGTGCAVTRAPQVIVDNTGRCRECVPDFTDTDSNGRAVDHTLGRRSLLVEVESFDTYISRRLRTETPNKARPVQADTLQYESQSKPGVGGSDGVIG